MSMMYSATLRMVNYHENIECTLAVQCNLTPKKQHNKTVHLPEDFVFTRRINQTIIIIYFIVKAT